MRLNSTGSDRSHPNIFVRLFRWIVILGGGPFILLHLLGLIYRIAPVPITANMIFTRPAGTELQKDWVRLDQISPYLVHAVIGAEDSRFCTHEGIDLGAIEQAIADNESRERQRGGSTLTQQTAKNVFLWNGGGYARKAAEAYLALYIDAIWGKRRVMEVYLNVAEWGDGIYGAEMAAQLRFGKSATDLTRREAALLASVLPSPNRWRVDPPGSYVAQRAGTIASRAATVDRQGLAACVLSGADQRVTPGPGPRPAPSDDDTENGAGESPSESADSFGDMLNRIETTLGDLDEGQEQEPEPQTDAETGRAPELNLEPETVQRKEPETEPAPVPQVEPQLQPEREAEPNLEPESEPESGPEPEPQLEPEPISTPETDPLESGSLETGEAQTSLPSPDDDDPENSDSESGELEDREADPPPEY